MQILVVLLSMIQKQISPGSHLIDMLYNNKIKNVNNIMSL